MTVTWPEIVLSSSRATSDKKNMHVSTLFEAGGLGAVLETDGYET